MEWGHGHEWNGAMAMNGIGPWPWTGAMDGGQSWWRTPKLAPISGRFRLARYAPEWP